MNRNSYQHLCSVCDSILRKNRGIYRTSIPLLHVLKEHPFILDQYWPIFQDNESTVCAKSTKTRFSQKKEKASWFFSKQTFSGIRDRKIDVIFVSHLVSADHLKSKEDFYFSNMPHYLKLKGVNPLIVLINHTDTDIQSSLIGSDDIPRLVIPKKLSIAREVLMSFGLAKEMLRLRIESNFERGLSRDTLKFFSSFRGSSGALFSLRVYNYIQQVFKHFNPTAVVTIYEGHAWERLVYRAAKDKDIFSAGYQHSVVTKDSHAMCRSLDNYYNPDAIYTTGEITNERLVEFFSKSRTVVKTLGSNKLSNMDPIDSSSSQSCVCLVVPEGLLDECKRLFSFTLECAYKLPNVKFIWRLHPQLSFDGVLEYMSISNSEIPDNIVISKSTLFDDISTSTHVVYRGSTAVVEAVYGGLFPVYVSDGSDMSIDLLYSVDHTIRKVVSSPKEFVSAINNASNSDIKKLQLFCRKYFQQLNTSVLLKDVKKNMGCADC